MKNYEYGLASPIPSASRGSVLVRPKSQHAMVSFSQPRQQQTSPRMSKEEPAKKQSQISTISNEYYINQSSSLRRPVRDLNGVRRNSQAIESETQKIRNFFAQKIQSAVRELREQIKNQSAQIVYLEKLLHKQQLQMQTKNSIIQKLISKIKKQNESKPFAIDQKHERLLQKRLRDMQVKIRLLVEQIQDQKSQGQKHIEYLTKNLLRQFGSRLCKSKSLVNSFVAEKQNALQKLEQKLSKIKQKSQKTSQFYRASSVNVKTDLKNSSDGSVKDTCSSSNRSKQSLNIQKVAFSSLQKQQSSFSDYFFHPIQPDQPNIKAIQQLVQQREKLPIRVFLDIQKRLKYWQSRTFIFDRRGNYTVPTLEQISYMQKQGWIKLLAQ